jgi:hypothetical protein
MAVYRVRRVDLDKGAKQESKEHPTMSERLSRRTARQHLQKYGPSYYVVEPLMEKIIDRKNKEMHVKPIRKVRRTPPGIFYTDYSSSF